MAFEWFFSWLWMRRCLHSNIRVCGETVDGSLSGFVAATKYTAENDCE